MFYHTRRYHLTEILATIVNEYTDWDRPIQHPVNIRDETLEALSDAQVVAPVINTADLHSTNRRNSYLFVFDYQTKYGDYQQVSFNKRYCFYPTIALMRSLPRGVVLQYVRRT